MLFNTSHNFDFPPELALQNSVTFLDVVEHTRLLGLQISTDLRWTEHTKYLCKKASTWMWMLRRMKILNIQPEIILDVYFKEIRSILEMGCQVFHSGLTNNQSRDIENIQKRSLKIILGSLYSNYDEACTLLSCEPLADRRHSGSESLKSGQNPTYLWFCPKLIILFLFRNQNLLFDSWPISTKYMSSLIYQSVKRGKKSSFICISYKAFLYQWSNFIITICMYTGLCFGHHLQTVEARKKFCIWKWVRIFPAIWYS